MDDPWGLRLALERLDQAACVFDRAGRYELVNAAAERLLGLPRERLLGRSYLEAPGARDGDDFDRTFRAVTADEQTRTLELRAGERTYAIELASGGERVLALWRETTETTRVQERTVSERDRWRTLFEQAPAQVGILIGPEHRYVFVNELARAAVGGRADLVGKTAREAFPELAGSPLFEVIDQVYRTGRPWVGSEVRVPFAGPNGKPEDRYFTFIYQPFREGTDVAGVMSFGFEVTEAVRARRRLETLFETNLIGSVTWSLAGRITRANDAFLAMVGHTRGDLESGRMSWRAMTPADHAEADERAMAELLERRVHAPYEKEFLRKDGSRVPVLVSAAFFPDSDDQGVSFIVDLSSVKRAEARIRELLEEARAASRAKDEFLAILGHELRNPLAPIATALELLRMRDVSGREVDTLGRQVAHLSRLVDDLLDVAKITRGAISIDRKPVELAHVVRRAVEMAEPLIETRRHRLEVRIDEPVVVIGDEARLAQAVSNLLVNAAKYSEHGGSIELEVRAERGEARVVVRDDGHGIAPDMHGSIFELFVRASDSHRVGGLGLGLPIVRNIARLHGGEVGVESDGLGRGSTFTVRLPLAPANHEAFVSPPVEREATARTRVLLVDDNADAVDLLARLLSLHGHATDVAYSGPEALAAAERSRPSVVVVDLGMPVMDGFEVARRLRARFGASVRLIALTGYGQPHDRSATAAAGFDAHLVKPVEPSTLLEALAHP